MADDQNGLILNLAPTKALGSKVREQASLTISPTGRLGLGGRHGLRVVDASSMGDDQVRIRKGAGYLEQDQDRREHESEGDAGGHRGPGLGLERSFHEHRNDPQWRRLVRRPVASSPASLQ